MGLASPIPGGKDITQRVLLTVIGPVFIQHRWHVVDKTCDRVGRALENSIGGTGALVSGLYRLAELGPARLITAVGRDSRADQIHQWCQKLGIEVFSAAVAAPTGQQCLIRLGNDWNVVATELGANPLLSAAVGTTISGNTEGPIFISMDVGGGLVEHVLSQWGNGHIYVSGTMGRLTDYRLLSRAKVLLLNRHQLGKLWGRPVEKLHHVEEAIQALSNLGVSRIMVCLSSEAAVVYDHGSYLWTSQSQTDIQDGPPSLPYGDFFVAGAVIGLEYGLAPLDAARAGLSMQNSMISGIADQKLPFAIRGSPWIQQFLLSS
ncbi:MAG: hypothetical protein OWU33_14570 [Firmicutes bacterium]|nr:hypothetical protein [Bacillota bacterium]